MNRLHALNATQNNPSSFQCAVMKNEEKPQKQGLTRHRPIATPGVYRGEFTKNK